MTHGMRTSLLTLLSKSAKPDEENNPSGEEDKGGHNKGKGKGRGKGEP
jgi:hypothetical protein